MIPVGTSVNPGELRSGPKWEKTFISYLQPPTLSLESTPRNWIPAQSQRPVTEIAKIDTETD